VSQTVEAQQFAAFLRMFKNRTDRSYEALAKRCGVSSSALHRYCAGVSVPTDYGPVQHFARECGATQPELRDLHRLWTLADAVRRGQPEPAAPPRPEQPPEAAPRQRSRTLLVMAFAAMASAAVWRVRGGAGRRRSQVARIPENS
jgi:ferric-dicitrate binding protein FerR (iron transport regulator)